MQRPFPEGYVYNSRTKGEIKMKLLKVLYIVSTLRSCGPVNQLFNLIKYLDGDRFEPLILTLSPEPQNSALQRFQKIGIQVQSLGLSRLQGFLRGASVLKNFVEQYSPDVIHTQGIRADWLSARYLRKYKRVATIRNYAYHDYPMTYGTLPGYYMAWQHLRDLQQIDLPVACSQTIAKKLQPHGLNTKAIQNGVDEKLYAPVTSQQRLALRQKLNIPADKRVFVSVGHLSTRKDPETVINGFLASKARDNSILLLIGDGSLKDACKLIAKGQSCIRFIGRISNVVDYLQSADYFISASLSEGLPNSVMEALACGLPVCLSDIEAHKEILSLNQKAGVMFDLGNTKALVERLNELVESETNLRSKAAVEIISNHLSAKKMSEHYQTLYKT